MERFKKISLILVLVTSALLWTACSRQTDFSDVPKVETAATLVKNAEGKSLHAAWDALLKAHVKNGVVSYKGFAADVKKLDAYLADLGAADPDKLTPNQGLAFWINAYNAFTIKLILKRYPDIKSIKDIPSRWDLKEWQIAGKMYSLNDMEHEILRKKYNEPRIHFAIVCASISCPDLLSEAFTAETLDKQLTQAAKQFLSNSSKGLKTQYGKSFTGAKTNEVVISKIFSWFEEDFQREGTTTIDYLLPYMDDADKAFVQKHKADLDVEYFDYDWNLNGF